VNLFKKIIGSIMERYQPEAIVIQMGADSVAGDKLGQFNLSSTAHSNCLQYTLQFNLPTIVLGGGGYSYYNVARTWTLETGVILNQTLDDLLPPNSYMRLPDNDNKLRIPSQPGRDRNSPQYLQSILEMTLETIRASELAPSIPIQPVSTNWHNNLSSDRDDPDTKYSDYYNAPPFSPDFSVLDEEKEAAAVFDSQSNLPTSSNFNSNLASSFKLNGDTILKAPITFSPANGGEMNLPSQEDLSDSFKESSIFTFTIPPTSPSSEKVVNPVPDFPQPDPNMEIVV